MLKRFVQALSLSWLILAPALSVNMANAASPKTEADNYSAWRAAAARALEGRHRQGGLGCT